MKNKHVSKNVELALPGIKTGSIEKSTKFNRAFQDALQVTRAYTLARDVQDIVDAALRREKQQ